jgi:kynurenine formamidase
MDRGEPYTADLDNLQRRNVFKGVSALALASAWAAALPTSGATLTPDTANVTLHGRSLRIVDLTHTLTDAVNKNPRGPRLTMESVEGSGVAVGMAMNRLHLIEHTGTHLDAPRHFSPTGASVGDIPISDLVVPLVVLDIKSRAAANPDTGVTPQDIEHWESKHGRLPDNCCVAMNSGWDRYLYRDPDPMPAGHFPGFTVEAATMLIEKRRVKGIAVDTLDIDVGKVGIAYPVHQLWLRSGRWGLEGIANLDAVPESGAVLIVGAAPIKDATGIPIRAIALF